MTDPQAVLQLGSQIHSAYSTTSALLFFHQFSSNYSKKRKKKSVENLLCIQHKKCCDKFCQLSEQTLV